MGALDETPVILRARQFIREAGIDTIPVDIARYAAAAGASIKVRTDLDDDESGQIFPVGDQHMIVVNGNHREERQRFTILHEIAHIVLDLPSQHSGAAMSTSDLMRYRRRPPEEIYCDVFAAECLMPPAPFKQDAASVDPSFDAIKELSKKYKASWAATGSRFAVHSIAVCAFALIEEGIVRYVSYSRRMREFKVWIDLGRPVPKGGVAERLIRDGARDQDYDEMAADVWFIGGRLGRRLLCEESILLPEWNQCLSLLWIDESVKDMRLEHDEADDDDAEPLLRELDGNLPWPSKRRRR